MHDVDMWCDCRGLTSQMKWLDLIIVILKDCYWPEGRDKILFKSVWWMETLTITPKAQFETHPDRNRNLWMWIMSSPHNPHSEPHKSFQHLTC